MVILSHDHMPWWKMEEGFGRNDIILCIIYMVAIKIARGGLNFPYFLFSFYFLFFIFNLSSFILFLELGLGLEWQDHAITQQVISDDMATSHMTYGRA